MFGRTCASKQVPTRKCCETARSQTCLDSLVSQKPVCSSLLYGTVTLVPVKLKVPATVPPPSNGLPFGGKKVRVMVPLT